MYYTVKGYYEDGKITLIEPAPVNIKTDVLVTFLTEDKPTKRKLGGLEGLVNLPDDFNEPLQL